MKRIILFTLTLTLVFLGMKQDLKGQTKVFDQTITWYHPPYEYGGYGFYWWHRTDGYSNINYGNMPSNNWLSPNDYYNGNFTMSVEVMSQPTNEPFYLQFGIWGDQHKGSLHTETVAGRQWVEGGSGSKGSYNLGSPSGWWNKQAGDPLDFSRADDFYRIGVVLWDGADICIPMGTEWSSDGCPDNADKYFPMTIKISVYATTGSGPPPPPPTETPSYTVDYIYEETLEAVVPEHEYSYDGTSYTTGTNNYVTLTPGQTTYFRVKADPSKVQTLNVPARPSAPTFGIDYVNERTSSTVSSEYQYSSNSDMSSSTSGDGSYVSLTPGSSTYFRKSATGSAFASNIQELFLPSGSTPDYSIDYWDERTNKVISSEDQFSYNSDFSGAEDGNGQYLYLTPGRNVYFRSKADNSKKQTLTVPYRPEAPSFEIDYINERTSTTVSSEYSYSDNGDMSASSSGDGSFVSLIPGSDKYFRKSATGSAFASGIQELLVPSKPDAPAVEIDFMNSRTSMIIESTTEYATQADMSDAASGTGEYVEISPGAVLYFRTKANSSAFLSNIQTLEAPARPVAPSFQIDYMKEEISAPIGSAYVYGSMADLSDAKQGSDNILKVVPGERLYFQAMATASAFASEIQTLTAPARPAGPSLGIDFVNERTDVAISSDMQYSGNSSFDPVMDGTGAALDLIPGTDIYFRTKGSASTFATEGFQLIVPERPVISSTESGTTTSYPLLASFTFSQEIVSLDASSITMVNAELNNISITGAGSGETVFQGHVYATANDVISMQAPANVVAEGNFVSNSFEIEFTGDLPGTGMEQNRSGGFTVFPNPGNGVFHLSFDKYSTLANYRLELCTLTGELVHTETFAGEQNYAVDLSAYPSGLYLMRVFENESISSVLKLIIK